MALMLQKKHNKTEKTYINYIVIALSIVVAVITAVRIFSNTSRNVSFGISGAADDSVQMVDARYLELEFDTPIAGLTGFGFRFEGNYENFGNSGLLITASIANDPMNPQMLYEGVMPLIEQAYDYQNKCYRVIVPFEGEIHQGDHLRIAIMGMNMSEEDEIFINLSSQPGIEGATFEINDFVQDSILAATFYYQARKVELYPVLVQGILCILLILLVAELRKKSKEKSKAVERGHISIRERVTKLIPIVLFLIIGLDYVYYLGVRTQLQDLKPADSVEIYMGEDAPFIKLCNGDAVFCQSSIAENRFGGFAIYPKIPYTENGLFTIEIRHAESQEIVATTKKAITELQKVEGSGELKLNFDSIIKKSEGEEYLISIYYSGTEPIELLSDGSEENKPILIPLYQKNSYLKLLFGIFCILITGFTFAVFICEQNGMRLEKLLFLSIALLGILFGLVITPFAIPDEAAHIDTAYRLSNQMLGVENSGIKDAIYKRECDIYTDSGIKATMNAESYRWLYDEWFNLEGSGNRKLIFAHDVTPNANALFWFPAAVGITIGRIFNIGFLPMIFLARMVNLLLAAWMIYLAVKKIPFGKSILCVIALLPLTLQQISTCSYDTLIIAASALYVSYCIFTIYSKEKIEKTDVLIILITAIMLGVCKGGVYTPLYLLGIYALVVKGYIRFPQRKKMKIAGIMLVIVLGLAGIFGVVYILRQPVDPYTLRNGQYSLAYLLQHPWKTIRIFEGTFYLDSSSYLAQYVGYNLSFQTSAKFIVPIGYSILLGVAIIRDKKYPYILNTQSKCVFLAAAVLCVMAIHLAMLITCTPYGRGVITGVQARYFIPVLWLMLISIRKGKIIQRGKKYRKIVIAGYVLGICTIMQFVINILNPIG